MSRLVAEGGSSPSKGWVRDGILSSLSKGQGTATEIANELGVSKATVSYHTKALIRRGMIEITDIKSVRGGVYSKTYGLKRGSPTLARLRDEQEGSLAKLDEWFERLLMSWHIQPMRKPADEIEIFLYHLFRLLSESGSMNEGTFEAYGQRVGSELIAPSLKFTTMKAGLNELSYYLGSESMAQVTTETRKTKEPRLVCMGCFENKEYGGLVCSFTKGLLTGAIRAKHGGRLGLEKMKQEAGDSGCTFVVQAKGVKP